MVSFLAAWFGKVNKKSIRCRRNRRLMVTAGVLSTLVVVIGIFDVVSTNASLAAGNIETNALILTFQGQFGSWWFLPKILIHLLLAFVILWLPSERMIWNARIGVVIYTIIIANNFHLADRMA